MGKVSKGISARRHAEAAFLIALESGKLEQWQADLEYIKHTLSIIELKALLQNPKIPFDNKASMLQDTLGEIQPLAMNLAQLLVLKSRLGIIDELVAEYNHLVDNYHGKEHAMVYTAIPIDDVIIEKIKSGITEMTGKEIILTTKIDPDIIGGMVIRIGDKVIDGSIRSKVQQLKRNLREHSFSS